MSTYKIKSHPVEVSRVTGVQPLMGRNTELVSPDVGLILVLEDSTKQKWLCETGGVVPTAGDFFVTDKDLHLAYIVPAVKFKELFRKSKG